MREVVPTDEAAELEATKRAIVAATVIRKPIDLTLYLIAADHAEALGRMALAAGCRACVRLQCRSWHCNVNGVYWHWNGERENVPSSLPRAVFGRLLRRSFETWEEAVEALGRVAGNG